MRPVKSMRLTGRVILPVVSLLVVLGVISGALTFSGRTAASESAQANQPPNGPEEGELLPDLQALLDFSRYEVSMSRALPPDIGELKGFLCHPPSSPLEGPTPIGIRFDTLVSILNEKGYLRPLSSCSLPEGENDRFFNIFITMAGVQNSAQLLVASLPVGSRSDGTTAAVSVAIDVNKPDRSIVMGHITNVYSLQPEEMSSINGRMEFNGEPFFTVQVGQPVGCGGGQVYTPDDGITWHRYWWYDSHHHKNWWYGSYWWFWWRYQWCGSQWWWWYNWWWGWYHWHYWWSWSTAW